METKDIEQLALSVASKSLAKKRKVGAVIVDCNNNLLGTGFNFSRNGRACEDTNGNTLPDVIHAEVAAICSMETIRKDNILAYPLTIFITHQPCENCQAAIRNANIDNIVVVNEFIKFDTGKPRYDLIPPSSMAGLAKVLTYGAKKYKPNNWKEVDSLDRYVAALYRHIEAWRQGEKVDSESGLLHLEHALTNVAFLLELDKPKIPKRKQRGINSNSN